jgi:hypothetical protein
MEHRGSACAGKSYSMDLDVHINEHGVLVERGATLHLCRSCFVRQEETIS